MVRLADGTATALDEFWFDPAKIMRDAGMTPDAWQKDVVECRDSRVLMLASRQAGKSVAAAAVAVLTAILEPPALILILSPTQRQSSELFRDKLMKLYRPVADLAPAARETALTLELRNGSRIVALPGDEDTIQGYSGVAMLLIDEASRVSDGLYFSVRPMLAVSGGRLIALSTPFGRRGFFFDEWEATANAWKKVKITADMCPRIDQEFLAEEKRSMGERWYRQEYLCSFEDTLDSVFSQEVIAAAMTRDVKPLTLGKLGG